LSYDDHTALFSYGDIFSILVAWGLMEVWSVSIDGLVGLPDLGVPVKKLLGINPQAQDMKDPVAGLRRGVRSRAFVALAVRGALSTIGATS
jgi:hypothetical protein